MLSNYPRHNLGVHLARCRPMVLDVDPASLVTKHFTSSKIHRGERLPDTVTVTTAAGGRHLYYRTPPERDAPRHVVRWLHGVDAHSSGVMVIPPSVGMNLLEYAFTGSSATRPAVLPDDVAARIASRPVHRARARRPHRTLHVPGRLHRVLR